MCAMSLFFCHLVEYIFNGIADGFNLILAVSWIAICVKCRSRGNNPAATSTESFSGGLGRPKQRHNAVYIFPIK